MSYLGVQPLQTSLAIIEEGSITTGKIANSAITTVKLNLTTLDANGRNGVYSFTGNTGRLGIVVRGGNSFSNVFGFDYSGIDITTANTVYFSDKPLARIGAYFTGGGSVLQFGTSNNYNSGITNAPLAIEQSGKVLVGSNVSTGYQALQVYGAGNDASVQVRRYSNDTAGAYMVLIKTRDTAPDGKTIIQSGDQLGQYGFAASTGNSLISIAAIESYIDTTGTVNATSLPSLITLATTPSGTTVGAERWRIINNGDTGIGTNAPTGRLTVRGRGATANTYGLVVQDVNNNNNLIIADDGSITSANVASAVGYKGTPINSQSVNYTLVPDDQGKTIVHPITDNNARTFTIPSNANVAYPIGTVLSFINMANTVTVAIAADTMYLAGSGNTISRTLATYGIASAIKLTANTWMISGNGLT